MLGVFFPLERNDSLDGFDFEIVYINITGFLQALHESSLVFRFVIVILIMFAFLIQCIRQVEYVVADIGEKLLRLVFKSGYLHIETIILEYFLNVVIFERSQ